MAAQGKIAFELVSPERLVFSGASEMVVIPGAEGLFAVMAGHTPQITLLKPGVIEVYDGTKIAERIFIDGGFAEVLPERCVVLAEQAVPVAKLDRAVIEKRIEDLRAKGVTTPDLVDGVPMGELAVQQAMLAAMSGAVTTGH